MTTGILIVITTIMLLLLILLIFIVVKRQGVGPGDLEAAVSSTWIKLGLGEKISEIGDRAREIRESYKSFEQMLRVPTERAHFGELSLETILSDQLPKEMFGIRQRVLDGKIPDAYIRSTVGIICIDSKFPLENYSRMIDAENTSEKNNFKTLFLRDVKGHLDKIAEDYVCPEKGSAEFAFAYIPSEGVYYFLAEEAWQILRDYTKRGVQVVSPLTLSPRIELIKAGVHAKKLSEDAEKVRNSLIRLAGQFKAIDELWQVFYRTHFKNLEGKAGELDQAYKNLRDQFERISEISEEE